jgi:hypothetical protein
VMRGATILGVARESWEVGLELLHLLLALPLAVTKRMHSTASALPDLPSIPSMLRLCYF